MHNLQARPIRLLISIVSLGLLAGVVRAFAAAGDLDLRFDGDGKLSTKVSTNNFGFDAAKAVLGQPEWPHRGGGQLLFSQQVRPQLGEDFLHRDVNDKPFSEE